MAATDIAALLQRVRGSGPHGRVLIVGHSNTVPTSSARSASRRPIAIGDAEYDNLFIVIPQPGGAPRLVRLRF